ncbi:tyrosine-type recombinase/integrase [Acetobacter persici]|uniref:Integrase n=1 Tax=Acetobacter persici TaxID=1076596 RepID=A0A6V8ICC7_9PROT|nr:integrase arm-type DNA-binding domain-containing protein [Acetobacter persici]OUI90861.1 integrase [Acetobacter persici]GFE94894.1 integrase [Acetobacter persici]
MLTDTAIRKAKPRDKQYKLYDERGLHLLVRPNGSRLWHYRYMFEGKEKTLSIGPYPEVSLAEARSARDSARADLRAGLNPAITKKLRRAQVAAEQNNTLEAAGRDWFALISPTWRPRHAASVLDSLERLVFPRLGAMPLRDITPQMVRDAVVDIEQARAPEIARRVRQRISAIYIHAIACGKAEGDPAGVIKAAFAPVQTRPQPAIIDLPGLREMLRAVDATPAHAVTRMAIRWLALTAARPGEVRLATWADIDGDEWVIPAERAKTHRAHTVPLSRQALDVLEAVRPITGGSPYIFPGARWALRPMSENALSYLLNRAGYAGRHVPHGFRASFSSIMNERSPADRAVIDLMLAHVPSNRVEGVYNRARHMARRKFLAQDWADILLEDFPPAAELLFLPRR